MRGYRRTIMRCYRRRSPVYTLVLTGSVVIGLVCLIFLVYKKSSQGHAFSRRVLDTNSDERHAIMSDATPETRHKHVIVLSQAQSGSGLVGDILRQDASVYYVFEPLRAITDTLSVDTKKQERVGDFSSANALLQRWRSEAKVIVERFLRCDFHDLDLTRLDEEFLSRSQTTKLLAECLQRARHLRSFFKPNVPTIPSSLTGGAAEVDNGRDLQLAECLSRAEKLCRLSKVKVVKLTRLMVRDLEPLLKDDPDLHIVLLVRDPRGSLWSRLTREHSGGRVTSTFVHSNCNVLDDDVSVAAELHRRYEGRVTLLRFEVLKDNILQVSKALYAHLGLDWSRDVKHRILAQTSGGPGGVPEGEAVDLVGARGRLQHQPRAGYHAGPAAAGGGGGGAEGQPLQAWRQNAAWGFVVLVQDKCFGVLRALGYRLFRLGYDLHDAGTPSWSREEATLSHAQGLWLC